MNVLSIETSCDDTSVAIVNSKRQVLACQVADQNSVHEPFGGIVPEIASRNHTHYILHILDQVMNTAQLGWDDLHGIAVTNRPGLVGSLIVGMMTAKTLSLAKKIPFLGVHHIEGHIVAPFLVDAHYQGPDFHQENFVALIVSGGHTSLYDVKGVGNYTLMGATIDDAAGEAFDKFAKMMGLPYPGGVHIDRRAAQGNPEAYAFPRPLIGNDGFDFSFSGLKTAGLRSLQKWGNKEISDEELSDLSASYQNAIVDVLIHQLEKAMKSTGYKRLVVSGGVSANSFLRERVKALSLAEGYEVGLPPLRYCTDNGAMIGLAGLWRLEKGESSALDLPPLPRASL